MPQKKTKSHTRQSSHSEHTDASFPFPQLDMNLSPRQRHNIVLFHQLCCTAAYPAASIQLSLLTAAAIYIAHITKFLHVTSNHQCSDLFHLYQMAAGVSVINVQWPHSTVFHSWALRKKWNVSPPWKQWSNSSVVDHFTHDILQSLLLSAKNNTTVTLAHSL